MASETKYCCRSMNETATSRGVSSGSLSAGCEDLWREPHRRCGSRRAVVSACDPPEPRARRTVAIIPGVEGRLRDADLGQRAPHRQRRMSRRAG